MVLDRRTAALAAALVLAAPPPAFPAQVAVLSAADGGGSFEFIFRQPGAAEGRAEIGAHEIVVRFPQKLPDEVDAELQSVLGRWIDSASMGYDSVLFHFARPVVARGERRGKSFVVTLTAAPVTTSPDAAAPDASRRLALTEARLLSLTGEGEAARRQLAALRASDPNDPAPVTLLAGIEQQAGRWRLASDLYREAIHLDGHDDDSRDAIHAIEREQASRLRLDFDYREVKGAERLSVMRLSGYALLADGWRSGGAVETAYVTTRSLLRTTGQSLPFEGVRNRGEAFLQRDFLDGQILRATAYAGMQAGGVGLDWQRPDDRGATIAHGEAGRPNWDFIDGLVNGATRNRLSIARQQAIGRTLSGRAEAGVNHYALPGLGGVGNSGTAAAELRWTAASGPRDLGLAYTLDGEYPWHIQSRLDDGGSPFQSLSLLKREVHALSATYAEDFATMPAPGHSHLVEAFGGWGIDRFGRPGPLFGATLTVTEGSLQIQLRASQIRHIGRGGESVTLVGGALQWLF